MTFPMKLTSLIFRKYRETIDLKVSKFQNEFMKASFLPKYERKIKEFRGFGATLFEDLELRKCRSS